jgi:hypothetical protein
MPFVLRRVDGLMARRGGAVLRGDQSIGEDGTDESDPAGDT